MPGLTWKRTLVLTIVAGILLLADWGCLERPPSNPDRPARQSRYDLDRDGCLETYSLREGRLSVSQEGRFLWESPRGWGVYNFVIADIDNDGGEELLMLLWKTGSYGRDKPFWYHGFDDRFSNHLFVYKLVNKKIKPVWCSSALPRPISDLQVVDTNQDGKNELVVSEGKYGILLDEKAPPSQPPSRLILRWQGWGFYALE